MTNKDYLELAKTAALKAGDFLKDRAGIKIDADLERDIKLSSDKGSEKIIIDALSISNLPVLCEESGFIGEKKKGLIWIVDPLDGSVNYLKNMEELTCISIALFDGETPLLGVIYRWKCGEMFSGIAGEGAFLNGEPIKPSAVTECKKAVLATGLPAGRDFSDAGLSGFVTLFQGFKKVRMLGAAALMASFVADGRIDVYMEEGIRLWDIAAAAAIVTAAGGVYSLQLGEPFAANQGDYKCVFRAFANKDLQADFEAKGFARYE
jgi:myo-inositol-1(or 4)-monophosphatase